MFRIILITLWTFASTSFSSQFTEEVNPPFVTQQQSINPFDQLPNEIMTHIFDYVCGTTLSDIKRSFDAFVFWNEQSHSLPDNEYRMLKFFEEQGRFDIQISNFKDALVTLSQVARLWADLTRESRYGLLQFCYQDVCTEIQDLENEYEYSPTCFDNVYNIYVNRAALRALKKERKKCQTYLKVFEHPKRSGKIHRFVCEFKKFTFLIF